MALINNNYVFVEQESVSRDNETSSHPIESGGEITDHVQSKPVQLSISGKIVEHDNIEAHEILSNLIKLKNTGSLITYIGRNIETNMQIVSFSTSHPNTIWGGCEFDMELKEVKIAKPAYVATETGTSTQQVEQGENEKVYHTVKKGDCVWNLVTKTYKSLEPKYSKVMDKCNWVMEQNPSAFSRKGDFRTLQIGKKILVGYRK